MRVKQIHFLKALKAGVVMAVDKNLAVTSEVAGGSVGQPPAVDVSFLEPELDY